MSNEQRLTLTKAIAKSDFEEVIAELWDEAMNDSEYAQRVEDALKGSELEDDLTATKAFRIDQLKSGIGPEAALALVVYFAPAINDVVSGVVLDVWREFILPGLKTHFGKGAIEEG